jgi:membrane fusion protein (multidrug efflux system)
MKLRHPVTILALLALAGIAGAAWWLQLGPGSAGTEAARSSGASGGAASMAGAGAAPGAGPGAGSGAGPGAGGGRPAGPAGGGPVAVEVAKAESMTLTDEVQAVGTLRSRQSVMLRPEVSGRIAQIGFREGQRVRRGQLMVQLDDSLQRAQLRQARAQASIASTNLQRSRELLGQGFISQSAVDQNAAALQVAEAQVALAEAQLARLRIVAPFDGAAGIRLVNLGDFVKDGADLVNVEDARAMAVDLRLPERYVSRTRPGQGVEVAVDAMAGRSFRGRVEALDSQVDANGRSLLVRATVDNADGVLKSGMFARARIVFATRGSAIVVPEEALVPQGSRQYIARVVDGPEGGKVARRLEAKVGLRLPGKVEILEGVAAGDLVVTAGAQRLMRDQPVPVRVVDIGAGGAPRGPAGAASAPAPGGTARPAGAGGPAAVPVRPANGA